MGEVAAVGEVHAEYGRARLDDGEVGRHVGLGAGVGLHVGVAAAEEGFGALDGQVLGHVDVFAAAVVAVARIAFGVFVGQDAALRLAHGGRNEVFRGDEFQLADLAVAFLHDGLREFRILEENFVHEACSLCSCARRPSA